MTSVAANSERRHPFAPDTYERVLAAAAAVLFVSVIAALIRGAPKWHFVTLQVWGHLATIMIALALTPVMLLRSRGDRFHRQLGWLWCGAMIATALLSFLVRAVNHGGFSFIHILSVWVLIQVPLIVRAAQTHNVKRHRFRVRAMVTGALLIAGFFTFPFNRMLGNWLFS